MGSAKPYPVSLLAAPPVFDSLPVAKIIDYPLEKRDYKPFAQCVLCVDKEWIHLRMWAFEVSVMPTSALVWVGYLFPQNPAAALCVQVEHGEDHRVEVACRLLENGVDKPLPPDAEKTLEARVVQHPHNGEDLQGVYWGRTLSVPIRGVEQAGGPVVLTAGESFRGNFYKLCAKDPYMHMGSYFPAQFPDKPFGPDSMGEFRIVSY